jgi:copper chaperone CopZ
MNTIKFKTNIKCTGCLSTVTPYLNDLAGEGNWNVDLDNPQRILTVEGGLSENEINTAVQKSGFTAEKI